MAEVARTTVGPGQVSVRIILATIHNHDIGTIRGRYGYWPKLPASAGTEAVGIVEEIGDGVDRQIGQRVSVTSSGGTWSEYLVLSAASAIPLPDAINDEVGAQLISMPVSALILLEAIDAPEGDWIVQNAANGAVGVTLAMLGKAKGLNILNIVRRSEGVKEMTSQGFPNVVSTDAKEWREAAKNIIGTGRVAAAIDSVGGSAPNDLLDLLSPKGQLIIFGSMSGEPLAINAGPLLFKQAVIKGFWSSLVMQEASPEKRAALYAEVISLASKGRLHLPVGGIFGLDDIAEAVRASRLPGRGGKILLRP